MHLISSVACILGGISLLAATKVSKAVFRSQSFRCNGEEHQLTTLSVLTGKAVSCAAKKDFARTYGYVRIIQRRLISSLGTPGDQIVDDAWFVREKLPAAYEEMPKLKFASLFDTMLAVDGDLDYRQAIIMLNYFSILNSPLLDAVETFPRPVLPEEIIGCLKSILELAEKASAALAVLVMVHHSQVSSELAERLLNEAVEVLKNQYGDTCNTILDALSLFSCQSIPPSIAQLLEILIVGALDLQPLKSQQEVSFDKRFPQEIALALTDLWSHVAHLRLLRFGNIVMRLLDIVPERNLGDKTTERFQFVSFYYGRAKGQDGSTYFLPPEGSWLAAVLPSSLDMVTLALCAKRLCNADLLELLVAPINSHDAIFILAQEMLSSADLILAGQTTPILSFIPSAVLMNSFFPLVCATWLKQNVPPHRLSSKMAALSHGFTIPPYLNADPVSRKSARNI